MVGIIQIKYLSKTMKFMDLMMQVISIIFRITAIRASPERVYVGDEPLESSNCNTPVGVSCTSH
jgi:hypothetical protein